ncbi:MAG: hypothetical protein HY722_09730 [Planctomycetes bacterium]|nr:hypothetical protein [Planctomycetota bacterium]
MKKDTHAASAGPTSGSIEQMLEDARAYDEARDQGLRLDPHGLHPRGGTVSCALFGEEFVAVAQAARTPRGLRVVRAALEGFEAGDLEGSGAEALRAALRRARVPRGRLLLGLPNGFVTYFVMDLPPVPPRQLLTAMELEVVKRTQSPADQVLWGYQALGEEEQDRGIQRNYLLAYMDRIVYERYAQVLRGAGGRLSAVGSPALALTSVLGWAREPGDPQQALAILHGTDLHLSVFGPGLVYFTRVIHLEGMEGSTDVDGALRIAENEVRKSLIFVYKKRAGVGVSRLLVDYPGYGEGFQRNMVRMLSIPVNPVRLCPSEAVEVDTPDLASMPGEVQGQLASLLLGAVLGNAPPSMVPYEVRTAKRRRAVAWASAAVAAAGLGAMSWYEVSERARLDLYLGDIQAKETEAQALEPYRVQLQDFLTMEAEGKPRVAFLEALEAGRADLAGAYEALRASIPENVVILEASFTPSGATAAARPARAPEGARPEAAPAGLLAVRGGSFPDAQGSDRIALFVSALRESGVFQGVTASIGEDATSPGRGGVRVGPPPAGPGPAGDGYVRFRIECELQARRP